VILLVFEKNSKDLVSLNRDILSLSDANRVSLASSEQVWDQVRMRNKFFPEDAVHATLVLSSRMILALSITGRVYYSLILVARRIRTTSAL